MKRQTIALVGRPNVGKSALFNRLAGRSISIVHDQPGVTRDWISAPAGWSGANCEIVDTGGIGAEPDPDFSKQTAAAARRAMEIADVIILVVDGRAGVTPLDADLASTLRGWRKPVLLAVNKIDEGKHENLAMEFHEMGLPELLAVSAAHGRGIQDLVRALEKHLAEVGDAPALEEGPRHPHIALVGRPNVGKSSLVNAILGEDRTIVSEIAGTTRDTVDILYEREGVSYIFCDTAGMRHRSRHRSPVEVFSVLRAEKAIRRADVCVLVVDATEGVTTQDKKICGLIQEAGKAAVIVLNKWDLVKWDAAAREIREKLFEGVREELFFLPYAPMLTLSAKSGESVSRLFTELERIRKAAEESIGTGILNRLLKGAMERQPPPLRKNRRFKILYATQGETTGRRPFAAPEFIIFVNDPELLDPGYKTYLEKAVRAIQPYPGLPVKFTFRGREKDQG